MNFLRLFPVIFSSLLLGAHYLRSGNWVLVAIALILPFTLLVKQKWVARGVQVLLVLGAAEWVHTMWSILQVRKAANEPWVRMVVILGAVALFTAASALVFETRALRRRYFDGAAA
jgi:hypothetical protein